MTMASETQNRARPSYPLEAWPPSDTEESVLGTDLHQSTITYLRWSINEVARRGLTPSQQPPWRALSQTTLFGCQRYDGSPYRVLPDVFAFTHPFDAQRGSASLALDGPPVLVIEVLSDATWEADIDIQRGKGYTYAHAGVREYLTLDPVGTFVPAHGLGWRLVDGVHSPWERDAEGRWQSAEIPLSIGLEGMLATVYTREGFRLPHEGEYGAELARRDEEIARQASELERLRAKLHESER
jgi:Uma2 family endonuclease